MRRIKFFLSERAQRVLLDRIQSEELPLTSEVPQGSVLGTSLFLLYINDIVDAVKFCEIKLFADDIFVYSVLESRDSAESFQTDLKRLSDSSEMLR